MKEGDRPQADVLVLFAFDNTLVDADSNVHIANELDAELATAVKVDNVDRPKAMDEFLLQLAKQRPQVSSVDICNAAQRLPVNQPIVDAIRLAVGDFGATCKIVSDSTVFGVQSFLDHHGLTDRVSEVVANPTHFEDGGKVLRVRPYQGDHLPPHGCSTCPGNLCKGQVLERILQQHRYSRVLYVGAGSEDFCPATKLGRNDVVFARAGETYELLPMLSGSPDKVRAHVLQWKSGGDIPAYFRNFFHRQYSGSCVSNALDIADDGGRFEVPRAVAQRHGKLLVIYDFDDSLVNEDSDTFAIQCFHPELLKSLESRHAQKPIWPIVFDDMLQIMDAELPEVTPEVICKRVAEIPIQKRMVDAVRMAVEQFGADVKIISDGNSLYIESVLKHQGLAPYINEVFTNPAEHEVMDNGRIRIRLRPFHPDHLDPIKCQWCPSNLCKGSILDSIRNANPYSRVVYVGDGPGDFCPASRLTKDDVVLARSHLLHGKPYGLQKRINEKPGVVQAPVVPWSTGYDIYRRFAQFCQQPYNIPRSTPRISGSVLVVFDYDWSLVNDNSDTFVFQQLYPELLATLRDRRAKQPSWTKIMDDMLGALAEDKPDITPDMIRDTVARVPILPHMLDALRLAKNYTMPM